MRTDTSCSPWQASDRWREFEADEVDAQGDTCSCCQHVARGLINKQEGAETKLDL